MKKKYLKIIANLTPFVLVASTTAVLSSCSINETKKVNIGELSDKIKSKIKEDLYMYSKDEYSKIIDEFKKALVEVVYEENEEFIDVIPDVDFFIDYQEIDETKSVKIVSLESSKKICGEISISLMRNLNNIRLNNVYIKEEDDNDEKIKEIVKDKLINDNDYKLVDKNDFDLGYLNLEIIEDKVNKKRYILVEPNNKKINPNSYLDKKNMFFSGEKKININIKINISKLNNNEDKLEISEYYIQEPHKAKETIALHLNNELKIFNEKDKIKYSDIDFDIVDDGYKIKATAKNESNSIYGEAFFNIKKIEKLDEKWFKSLILSEKNRAKWKELIENQIRENNKDKNKEWFEEAFKHLEIEEVPNVNNKKILNVFCLSKSLNSGCYINIYQVYDLNNNDLKENFDKKISNKESDESIKKYIINFIRNDYINKNGFIPKDYDENKIKEEHILINKNGNFIDVQSKNSSLLFNAGFKFELNDEKVDLSRLNDSLYIPAHWINNSSKYEKLINKKIYEYLKKNIFSLEESDFEVDIKNQKISAKKESKLVQGSFNFKSKETIPIESIKDKIPPINTNNLEYLYVYIINKFKEESKDEVELIKDVDFKIIINDNDKWITVKSLDESEKTFGEFVIKYSKIIDISYLEDDKKLPILYEGDEKYEDKIAKFIDKSFCDSFLKKDIDYKISGSIKDFNGSILVKAIPNNSKISGQFSIKIKEKINIKNIKSISNISITKNSDLEETKKEAINKINEYKSQRQEFKNLEDITEVDIEASKFDKGIIIRGKENSLKVKGEITILYSRLFNIESLNFANDEIRTKRWFTKNEAITSIINYLKEKVNFKITEKDIDINKITEQNIKIGQIFLYASEKSEYIEGKKEIHLPELKNLKEYIAKEKFEGGVLSKDVVRERIKVRIESIDELKNDGIKEGEDYKIDFLNNSKNDPIDVGGQAKITILKNEKCQRLYYDNNNESNNVFYIKLDIPNITFSINTFSFVKDKYYYTGGKEKIDDRFQKTHLVKYNLVKHIYSIYKDPIVKFEIPEPKEASQKKSLQDDIYWYLYALVDDDNNLHFVGQKKDPSNPKGGNVFWKFQRGYAYIQVSNKHKNEIPFYFEKFKVN